MKIIMENCGLEDFETWSGGTDLKEEIIKAGKESAFECLIEDLYPEGLTTTALNDLLSYDKEWIYEALGMQEDEEEEEVEEWYAIAGEKYRVIGEETFLEVETVVIAIDSSSEPYCIPEEDLKELDITIEEIYDSEKRELRDEYRNVVTIISTSELEEIEE
jgi:hypothetical protein